MPTRKQQSETAGLGNVTRLARASQPLLPEPFAGWFATRGWTPRPHQLALLELAG